MNTRPQREQHHSGDAAAGRDALKGVASAPHPGHLGFLDSIPASLQSSAILVPPRGTRHLREQGAAESIDGAPKGLGNPAWASSFWSHVDQTGGFFACWPWLGRIHPKGYGDFYVAEQKRPLLAHRVAFFLSNGYWPDTAMHECDNRPCCNPFHLKDGTIALNNADMKAKGRYNLSGLKQYQALSGIVSAAAECEGAATSPVAALNLEMA